ncbi:MAG: hypothetical protein ACOX21_05730 [Bacillota bacterium]
MQPIPMFLTDEADYIIWSNRLAKWLFSIDKKRNRLVQLPAGESLAIYADRVRQGHEPLLFSLTLEGVCIDVEINSVGEGEIAFKFHPVAMTRDSTLEMHKFMQDFALEAGDRVNNPLTTVLNCLQLIKRDAEAGSTANISLYAERALREAFIMKDFGEWVRRLSEEPPCHDVFDLVQILVEVLTRRACEQYLHVQGDIPPVKGCSEHARVILGGLVNLCRQASSTRTCSITVHTRRRNLVVVEICPQGTQVRDLRMLTSEFYGGLGLMAARYLLALMQAQIIVGFMGNTGIRVTFLASARGH